MVSICSYQILFQLTKLLHSETENHSAPEEQESNAAVLAKGQGTEAYVQR